MPGALYGRRARLTLAIPVSTPGDFTHVTTDVLEIQGGDDPANPGMRIQFEVAKTVEKEPNTSKVVVSNLSPTTRAGLQKKGVKVTLEAGYVATGMSRIFVGDARTIDHVRNGPDWDTTIKLGDGERSIRFARFNESFAPGTSAGDVLTALANASGLAVGNVPDVVANLTTFDQGYAVSGRVDKSLDRLVKSLGYKYSVQDGALQILTPGQALNSSVPDVSPSTGLIGSPEMGTPEKKGQPALLKFRSLLVPVIPGGKVKLTSERYDGVFVRIKKVKFTGDTHGGEWYSDMEGTILPNGR